MINLSLNDETQAEIGRHLAVTESLLSRTASKLSGAEKQAHIWLLPDLGLPRSIQRIHGGFYIGAFYSWETTVPFIPVDATVNSCGVSVFEIDKPVESERHFIGLIQKAMKNTDSTSFLWNFDTGNHFISLCKLSTLRDNSERQFAVLHSSACEFKQQYNGLYPDEANWYRNHVKVLEAPENRFLRYLEGDMATRFIRIAGLLREYNQVRHQMFAGMIFGENAITREVSNSQHYGMPTNNSIAIGCQWVKQNEDFLLLTDSEGELNFVRPTCNGDNSIRIDEKELILVPHGLGNEAINKCKLDYESDGIRLNGKKFHSSGKFEFGTDINVRGIGCSKREKSMIINHILKKCPGRITRKLEQLYNYNRDTKFL